MTENEAIEILKKNYPKTCKMVNGRYRGGFDNTECDFGQALTTVITALKEIQQYREIGTVDKCKTAMDYWKYLRNRRCGLDAVVEKCMQYEQIGTVKECREAMERQKPKKCDVTKDNFRIYYKCPTCNHSLRIEYNHGSWLGKKSKNCSKCGQAINWEESEEE